MDPIYVSFFRGLALAIGVMIGVMALSGCAKQAPEPVLAVAPYCDVYKPILWSANDTRKTKEQVDTENRIWKRLCDKADK